MRPGCLFLNLSRGFVVDHAALRRGIESGTWPAPPSTCSRRSRAAAARSSPRPAGPAERHPHAARRRHDRRSPAGYRRVRGREAARLRPLGRDRAERQPARVALPHTPGTHRLVHLHRNVPGVLATINQLLAEHRVNIEGQPLGTRDDLGYVLTDIGTDTPTTCWPACATWTSRSACAPPAPAEPGPGHWPRAGFRCGRIVRAYSAEAVAGAVAWRSAASGTGSWVRPRCSSSRHSMSRCSLAHRTSRAFRPSPGSPRLIAIRAQCSRRLRAAGSRSPAGARACR